MIHQRGAHGSDAEHGYLPVVGHMNEVEEFDGHEIEDWTVNVVHLETDDAPDVFLDADVTPVFTRNYKR